MADNEIVEYTKYYTGSCLVKFEKSLDDYYLTEIKVQDGKAKLITTKNHDEIIEEHDLGIIDVKPLDVSTGRYGKGE